MKNVLIFGGSGFIGYHLCNYLTGRDDIETVIVADIKPPLTKHDKIVYKKIDVREQISLAFPKKIDTVYNFAAVHTTPGHAPHEYYETNIMGTININKYCTENQIKKIVFTSTMSIYPTGVGEKSENTAPGPINDYGMSKLICETIHSHWAANPGNKLIICRPAVIFGPLEQGNFTRLAKLCKLKVFIFPGSKTTVKSCYYVKRLISDIQFAVQLDEDKICFNGSYNGQVTLADIRNAFAAVYEKSLLNLHIPKPLLKVISYLLKPFDFFGFGIHPDRIEKLVTVTNIKPSWLSDQNRDVDKIYLIEDLRDWFQENGFK